MHAIPRWGARSKDNGGRAMSAPPTNVAGVQKIDPVRTRTGWIMLWYFSPSSPVFLSLLNLKQNETRKQRMKSLTLLYTTDKLPLISTCGLSHMENRLFYVHFWILITAPPLYTHVQRGKRWGMSGGQHTAARCEDIQWTLAWEARTWCRWGAVAKPQTVQWWVLRLREFCRGIYMLTSSICQSKAIRGKYFACWSFKLSIWRSSLKPVSGCKDFVVRDRMVRFY